MRSSSLPAALALLAFAFSCGHGVDDLSLEVPPIAQLQGRVDLAAIAASAAGRPLRAALIWGAVPGSVVACLKFPMNAELQAACPDPFGFVPGEVAAEVEVAADGSFVIPVRRLPDANFAIGDAARRIAWGSVIVAADADGDDALEFFAVSEKRSDPETLADPVLAASFFTLHEPQQRLAFREGGWDGESRFYPATGCAPPPAGFSVLSTPGLRDFSLDPAPGECTSAGLENSTLVATPLPEGQGKALACRSLNLSSIRKPDATAPGEQPGQQEPEQKLGKQVCLDAQTLAFIGEGDCPRITVFPLVGCRDNLVCLEPDWDLTAEPPEWWPCAAR